VASVDTNVLLRSLLGDVPKQAERVDQLIASGTTLVVEDAALIEVVFVLKRVMLLSRASVAKRSPRSSRRRPSTSTANAGAP
jgi:predicted nucleic acid-binding protein